VVKLTPKVRDQAWVLRCKGWRAAGRLWARRSILEGLTLANTYICQDFHNFNIVFRDHPEFHVVAFTATQIPDIASRRYPPVLAGRGYPDGIPIIEENQEKVIKRERVDVVVFS
jgi:hypothetical protein